MSRKATIEAIETVSIRVPLSRVYRGSQYQMTHRSTIVARVHTDVGVVGEAYVGDEDEGLDKIEEILHEELAPVVLGQELLASERIWRATRPAAFDILRDRRLGLVAAAAVDAAVWDAIGKLLGVPLWKLWGGFHDDVAVISIGGYYDSELTVGEEVEILRLRGLAGMKLKVGGRTPEEDAERFRQARAAGGDDFILCADANQGYSPEEAVRFARLVADHGLFWFEEPCRWPNDHRGMRDVRFHSGARVCAGQSELSATGCLDLINAGAVDFCNFDSSWSGGATEWRRVAALAAMVDVGMAHHEEPQMSAHLLASIPHGTFVEVFDPQRDPIWWNLVANRPALDRGRMRLGDRPGLGWDLDTDYVGEHLHSSRISAREE
ncbi:MAG TPA: mandelate racemase/muconate lactonizing enzyme family protein [Solirubrobacterales bacterium]|nr:mandelate racemase/muconate lactonizing enzyme family protein [Solirubrobacterales bacterium]